MQRGWSSFADTRQKPNATSSIRTRVFSRFSRRVCRRRWPSGSRPQAPQRPKDFRKAHRRAKSTGQPGRVSAVAGACGAERNQPASKARPRTLTTCGFTAARVDFNAGGIGPIAAMLGRGPFLQRIFPSSIAPVLFQGPILRSSLFQHRCPEANPQRLELDRYLG